MVRFLRKDIVSGLVSRLFYSTQVHKRFAPEVPVPKAKRLEGKVALITGGASGIGEMAVRLFAAHGARVVFADIQEGLGAELATELNNRGESVQFIRCDVTKEEEIVAAVKCAENPDIVYCCAGILGAIGSLDETHVDEFDRTLAVNLRGTFLTVKHASRLMKQAQRGSIVCTGSVTSVIGGLGPHAYTVSKSAIAGLVRSACVELRAHGVRINMVSPDGVATPLFVNGYEALEQEACTPELLKQRMEDMSVMCGGKRTLTTLDVAQAALFLASDESGYISGHNLLVDCGNSITKPTENARWYTTYLPMFREGGKVGLD